MKSFSNTVIGASILFFACSGAASADVIYSVSDVTLQGGGQLSGTFTTNDALSALVAVNITASQQGNFPGFTYTTANSTISESLPSQYFRLDSGGNELQLDFSSPLSLSGAALSMNQSSDHEPAGGNRLASGNVILAVVPEPGTVSLMLAGLLGLAYVTLRRRRRSEDASLAAAS